MILQGVSFTCRPGSILIDDLQLPLFGMISSLVQLIFVSEFIGVGPVYCSLKQILSRS